MEKITKKVKVDYPQKIFMAEAALENQVKLDEEKVECIRDYCKVGVDCAKSKITFPQVEEAAFNRTLDWWLDKSQRWGTFAVGKKFSNTVMLQN